MGRELTAVGQADDPGRAAHLEARHLGGEQHLRPEASGLGGRPPGKVTAGDAGWESQVVLDAGALAGLAPDRLLLDENGAQSFRGAVDGRPEPGRPTPDDDEVVEGERRCRRQPEGAGDLCGGGRLQRPAGVGDDQGQVLAVAAVGGQQPGGLRVTFPLEPSERHLIAGEEVLDRMRGR